MPVPTPSVTLLAIPPPAAAAGPAAAAAFGLAFHSSTAATAWSISPGPSEMAFLTPTSIVGLPANRPC